MSTADDQNHEFQQRLSVTPAVHDRTSDLKKKRANYWPIQSNWLETFILFHYSTAYWFFPMCVQQTVYDQIQLSRMKDVPLSFYQEVSWTIWTSAALWDCLAAAASNPENFHHCHVSFLQLPNRNVYWGILGSRLKSGHKVAQWFLSSGKKGVKKMNKLLFFIILVNVV